MTQMTGGEVVAATLARMGVRHVFGIVSVHNLPIYDALSLRRDIEIVNVRHEQAAAQRGRCLLASERGIVRRFDLHRSRALVNAVAGPLRSSICLVQSFNDHRPDRISVSEAREKAFYTNTRRKPRC